MGKNEKMFSVLSVSLYFFHSSVNMHITCNIINDEARRTWDQRGCAFESHQQIVFCPLARHFARIAYYLY